MSDDTTIEYFFSAHSAYAYLGAWRLDEIAKDAKWDVAYRPIDLGPVIAASSGTSFGSRSAAHADYFFGRDMFRWAQWRGLPMIRHRPTHHDNPLALPNGMIIAAGADAGPLSRAIMLNHWRDDGDIADPDNLRALAEGLDLDGEALLQAAQSTQVKAAHDKNTAEAIARGVFGSPTYFVRGDMFYGQDRLDMLARAIQTPFAP